MEAIDFNDPRAVAQWRDTYASLKRDRKLRQREAALQMGVSEAQAVAAHIGITSTRLKPDFMSLIKAMPQLGAVMTLTRNEAAVHEKDGAFETVSGEGPVGLVLGADIDLRIFHRTWAFGFAVTEPSAHGEMKSFQFYDGQGEAVFKVFLRAHSNHNAYDALAAEWADPTQSASLILSAAAPAATVRDDAEIDVAGFHAAWDAMTDTHEFFPLLRTFGVTRTQALRLAEPRYATPLDNDAISALLTRAAADQTPIMVFVGNPGMIQIHTGPVTTIRSMGPWLNVLDDTFSLHLRADLVAQTWLVRKPTQDGIVTSVELFDAAGTNIAMLFGARKPGQPELTAWRNLTDALRTSRTTSPRQ